MKKTNNNMTVSVVKGKGKGKSAPAPATVIEVTATPVSAPALPAPAPAEIPAPAIQVALPAPAPATLQMGVPNLVSRRISLRMDEIVTYRIANNQRKDTPAKYYVQGGAYRVDPLNTSRSRFEVALEIPYVDLYQAKLKLAEYLRSLTAPAPATTEVTKIA